MEIITCRFSNQFFIDLSASGVLQVFSIKELGDSLEYQLACGGGGMEDSFPFPPMQEEGSEAGERLVDAQEQLIFDIDVNPDAFEYTPARQNLRQIDYLLRPLPGERFSSCMHCQPVPMSLPLS